MAPAPHATATPRPEDHRHLVDSGSDREGLFDALQLRAPHLFADEPRFLDAATVQRLQAAIDAIEAAIDAIEATIATPGWQAAALEHARPWRTWPPARAACSTATTSIWGRVARNSSKSKRTPAARC